MFINLILIIISTYVAFNGLILQPHKNPDNPKKLNNLSRAGKTIFVLIIISSSFLIIKNIIDSRETKKITEINSSLISETKKMATINNHLIKVMSVADGYNVIIRGVIVIYTTTDNNIRHSLTNILKGIEVTFNATNELGEYKGDLHSEAQVLKYIRLPNQDLKKYNIFRIDNYYVGNCYYFEIEFDKVKIFSKDKIQYARFDSIDTFSINVNSSYTSDIYMNLYKVETLMISEIEIVELETIELWKNINLHDNKYLRSKYNY